MAQATSAKRLGDADVARIREAVREAVAEHHLPGIAVGVVIGDELVYQEGFGYADIESKRPQDPALRQRIGSITKTMTALCAMALVDEGRLSLDDRLVDRLPDVTFHGPAEEITLRHLLTHTSGIGEVPMPDDLREPGLMLWSSDGPDDTPVPEVYPNGITIDVAPGTKWAYANHGFALLGEIVRRLEGEPHIDAVLRRRIFEPLGMAGADCLDRPHPNLTTGYHRALTAEERALRERAGMPAPPDGEAVDGYNIRGGYEYEKGLAMPAAGAVQANIPDMARYASALLRRGAGIVRPETFEQMIAPQWCPDERLSSVGLAFLRERRFGRPTFGHGGGVTGGWNTHLCIVPDEDLALLTHLNLAYDKFMQVDGRILQAALDAPDAKPLDRPVDPSLLASAPGVYEARPGALTNFRIVTGTGRIQLSAREGELWLHARRGPWKEGKRLVPADAADPAFFMLDTREPEPPCVALLRDADGRVTGLRHDRLVEMVRTEQVAPWV
jgi:CubicO group peptidase (beta-lactamase class C family)